MAERCNSDQRSKIKRILRNAASICLAPLMYPTRLCGSCVTHSWQLLHLSINALIPTTNHSPLEIMSQPSSSSASPFNFDSIFNSALDAYKKRTKQDLTSHPLLPTLQACDSPDAVLTVLQEQILAFSQSQNADERLTKWLVPTVNVLYGFSGALGEGVSLVNIKTIPC